MRSSLCQIANKTEARTYKLARLPLVAFAQAASSVAVLGLVVSLPIP